MLDVTFYRDGRQRLSSLFARGHANFAEAGEDIICAAVSAILQAARLGLESYAKIELDVAQSEGNLRLRWSESARDDAALRAIVSTAELAVEQIATQFPEHVTFHREIAATTEQ